MDYGTVSTVCLASDNILDLEKFSIEIFNFQYVVKQKPSNHSVQPQVTKTILWTNQYTFRKLNAHSQCKTRENMLSLFTLVCFYFRLDNKVESFKLITWWSDAKLIKANRTKYSQIILTLEGKKFFNNGSYLLSVLSVDCISQYVHHHLVRTLAECWSKCGDTLLILDSSQLSVGCVSVDVCQQMCVSWVSLE